MMRLFYVLLLTMFGLSECAFAQELDCKVTINRSQIQGTNLTVFETLQKAITEFMNNRSWTEMQFKDNERIECTMNITVKQYKEADNSFKGELLFQIARPVFNSNYNTTVFSMKDSEFNFVYKEHVSADSVYLDTHLKRVINELSIEDRKAFVASLFNLLKSTGAKTLTELANSKKKFVSNLVKLRKDDKNILNEIFFKKVLNDQRMRKIFGTLFMEYNKRD